MAKANGDPSLKELFSNLHELPDGEKNPQPHELADDRKNPQHSDGRKNPQHNDWKPHARMKQATSSHPKQAKIA
ncbi:uncharacterized protein G2W53_004033 [Senna tora]|uniref:Uncharacterized protein n=1 Tax=Senna tora TaxID=362788 RepID=A0A834XB29_9FABA|nr:uncharacterized protein G2W53_004033 [Senna tora]